MARTQFRALRLPGRANSGVRPREWATMGPDGLAWRDYQNPGTAPAYWPLVTDYIGARLRDRVRVGVLHLAATDQSPLRSLLDCVEECDAIEAANRKWRADLDEQAARGEHDEREMQERRERFREEAERVFPPYSPPPEEEAFDDVRRFAEPGYYGRVDARMDQTAHHLLVGAALAEWYRLDGLRKQALAIADARMEAIVARRKPRKRRGGHKHGSKGKR